MLTRAVRRRQDLRFTQLASAAPSSRILDPKNEYDTFNAQKSSSPPPYSLPSLAPDLSKIIMIDHTIASAPPSMDATRSKDYVRGNIWEVEVTLEACLQIHRWDRAITILAQLRALYAGNEPELQRLYNKVLQAMVFDHIWNRSSDNIDRINGWVENHMKKANVSPNAQTFALKIKAAMATLEGRRRDRTVRRYWDMAKEYNVDWEVASLREILSDGDLGKLSEISPLELDADMADNAALDDEDLLVHDDVLSEPALPSVRETVQKGFGMPSLQKSLSLFNDYDHLAEWENLKTADAEVRQAYARQRQTRLERDALAAATDRWKVEHDNLTKMGVAPAMTHGKVGSLMWTWHEKLAESIKAELERVTEAEQMQGGRLSEEIRLRTEYGPLLRLLEPNILAALTCTSTITFMNRLGLDDPVKLARLVVEVGHAIENEINVQYKAQKEKLRQARLSSDNKPSRGPRDYLAELDEIPPRIAWSSTQAAKVGSILLEMLFDVAKLNIVHRDAEGRKTIFQTDAFERSSRNVNGKWAGVVLLHSAFVEMLSKEPVADLLVKQLPMVCEPRPWTGYNDGGYLVSETNVIRVKSADVAQKEYASAAAQRGDLDLLFKGLDVLGQTGWRVNHDVFKVMLEAWNTGQAVANLAPLIDESVNGPEMPENASPRERYDHYRRVEAYKNMQSGLHSNRCFQNFQMEIARAFRNETFYLPHNVDFRGRAYPIPPYLNQMGADNARGLLLFSEGKQLGAHGFKWLKVHLANVCGYDKASLTDRAQYADAHMDDIRDSVENPHSGRRWWLSAEDPWQCLATCHEIVKAIDSGNPETFVSHLPIHQDGTCNGLQHYAALGGDIAGARQVNLEPGDRPADVYTGVAELVKAEIKKDAEAGNSLAIELDGKITRKIVKQTVMTNVYGVTFEGARLQVKKQLDDALPELKQKKLAMSASTYVAKKIFKGLGSLFEGAHDIQYWFGDCANRITSSISPAQLEELSGPQQTGPKFDKRKRSRTIPLAERAMIEPRDFRSTVVWTTPLKLPIAQPYRIPNMQPINTHLAQIILHEPNITESVDKRKQLQGFPPNFIHSLDATHMMLSAIEAHERGLTFSAVHDSFWTHAADVDILSSLLRDAFIRMHSEDIIGRLAEEFKLRYKGHLRLAKIKLNSPLAKAIKSWRSNNRTKIAKTSSVKKGKVNNAEKHQQYWELAQEYNRQKLLTSDNPEDVAKGRRIVTPASLFEQDDGEKYLKASASLGESATHKVPESQQDPSSSAVKEALSNDEIDESHDVDMISTLEPILDGAEKPNPSPVTEAESAKKKTPEKFLWLWLPLTFKPVPQKGDWDVRRLKDSVYFFS
ncbi:DNA-directed RNA polymerase [Lithohypha guttulata]|uniref:DNA-directed RNA polymerase n=1 Tax=Lithohypha guttulata TaxID=1690604 RepID=UPI002DDEA748|nr:DNA-directed RNA polymerase [Lithohypha guttulata]